MPFMGRPLAAGTTAKSSVAAAWGQASLRQEKTDTQNEEMPESISSFRLEKENMKKHGNVKN